MAKWYLAVRKACTTCTVLGADVVDRSNAASWTQRLVKAAKRQPVGWGLHAYNDVNTFTTASTRAFLKGTKGQVWLTETGGVLDRSNPRYAFSGCGTQHAARATEYLLRQLTPISSRITHVYLYSWSTGELDRSWDSGLIGPYGETRPALDVVRGWLGLGPADPTPIPPDLQPATVSPCHAGPAFVAKKKATPKKKKASAKTKAKTPAAKRKGSRTR